MCLCKLFTKYIMESPDKPIGDVLHLFAHDPWGDKHINGVANLCHWHLDVRTHDVGAKCPKEHQLALEQALGNLTCQIEGALNYMPNVDNRVHWEGLACSKLLQVYG